jgi:hypothetical protein
MAPLFGQAPAGNGGTHRIGRSKSCSGQLTFNATDEVAVWKQRSLWKVLTNELTS